MNIDIPELSEEQQSIAEARLAKLSAFAGKITGKRKEAIDGRKLSGIEEVWLGDDEYYVGTDSMNKGEGMLKGSSPTGRVTMRSNDVTQSSRSTVFVNISAPYVDIGAARVADMALPTEDKPFAIKTTPIPEMVEHVTNNNEMMPGGQHTVGEASQAFLDDMNKKADAAENQIWDWLCESRWHSEVRKVIEQAARVGTGCIKGPFPKKVKKRKMSKDTDGNITLIIEDEIKPAMKAVDVYNLYPDPSCGHNIHAGTYIFEKDLINARQLRELKGTGYIDSEIDAVLKEGPSKLHIDEKRKLVETENFEIWYYYGMASKGDLEAADCECEDKDMMPVVISMVNDRIIKASMSLLDSGEFPYDVMCWQRRTDHWAGIGVARQVRTAQRMVNAASRNLMDNAGLSAGVQIIMRDGVIYPADGNWEITPMKIWRVDEDSTEVQVQHAITTIAIPSMQAELMNIIKMAQDFAEKATSMPLILQGAIGSAPETVGGLTLLNKNANTVLRRLAKIYDDDLVCPIILRFYEWLMIYGSDEMKGDYCVQALGSSSFFERDSIDQQILQLIPMAANPAFGIDAAKLMVEILKMSNISPNRVLLSDEQKKLLQEQAAKNPVEIPAVQVAKIRAQAGTDAAKIKSQSDVQEAQLKQQGNEAQSQSRMQEFSEESRLKLELAKGEHDSKMALAQVEYQVEMMRLSQSSKLSLDVIKSQLATVSMKLGVQKELSGIDRVNRQNQDSIDKQHDHTSKLADILHQKETQDASHRHEQAMQALTPLVEPIAKAESGKAFFQ